MGGLVVFLRHLGRLLGDASSLAYDGYESVGCVFVVEEDRKQEVVDGHWLRWLLASNRGVAHSIRS